MHHSVFKNYQIILEKLKNSEIILLSYNSNSKVWPIFVDTVKKYS